MWILFTFQGSVSSSQSPFVQMPGEYFNSISNYSLWNLNQASGLPFFHNHLTVLPKLCSFKIVLSKIQNQRRTELIQSFLNLKFILSWKQPFDPKLLGQRQYKLCPWYSFKMSKVLTPRSERWGICFQTERGKRPASRGSQALGSAFWIHFNACVSLNTPVGM